MLKKLATRVGGIEIKVKSSTRKIERIADIVNARNRGDDNVVRT